MCYHLLWNMIFMNKSTISLVIPAYNEGERLAVTLSAVDYDYFEEIIVVNDGSRDQTLTVLKETEFKEYPLLVVNLSKNRGKGYAVWRGLQAARGEVIVVADADLKESINEVKKLIPPVVNGDCELSLAEIPIKAGGLGMVRLLADRGLQFITGQRLRNPLSGQRCFKKGLIKEITPLSPGFGLEMGINIELLKKGYRIKEIKTGIEHRITSRDFSGFWHRWRQFCAILKTLIWKTLSD